MQSLRTHKPAPQITKQAAELVIAILLTAALIPGQEQGRIMRPVDKAALPTETIDIIATAPGGHLEIDGKKIEASEPFPDVFQATATVEAGEHRLALVWEGGRKEIRIFTGENPPPDFQPFQTHPPVKTIECTQCHGVSRRGRFRFEGGCFACHMEETFAKTHSHQPHVLQECGLCHNAHGSTAARHLLYPKEKACKLCHG